MGYLPIDDSDYMHRPLGDEPDEPCTKCHVRACEQNLHGGDTKICDLIEKGTYDSHRAAEKLVFLSIEVDTMARCPSCIHWQTFVKPEEHGGDCCEFPANWTELDPAARGNHPVVRTMRLRLDDRLDAVNLQLRKLHGVASGERSLEGYDTTTPDKAHSADMQKRFDLKGEPLPERRKPVPKALREAILQMKAEGEL